jgi:helicase
MAFRRLFIGIDHYASNEINWLSRARRDATALPALFMDTFGGEGASFSVSRLARRKLKRVRRHDGFAFWLPVHRLLLCHLYR